jgi:hypothetical protein
MGRGRAKAKQTKVARQLKYTSTGPDLNALAAELSGGTSVGHVPEVEDDEDDDLYDRWADEDDDEDETPQGRHR